jgi:exosortase A
MSQSLIHPKGGAMTERSFSPEPATTVAPTLFQEASWRHAGVLVAVLFLAILALFWPTFRSIERTWSGSRTFSHGFLIFPIFLYLLWQRRDRIRRLRPKPNYWVLPMLAVACVSWLLGNLGDIRVVQQFSAVAILDLSIWMLLGTAIVRMLWFPLAFLFFAVPFGEFLISPLQDFTARFAVAALRLSQVPVVLESRIIYVPSGPWVIAEACSGISYLISSLVLGLVYASAVYRSLYRRLLFVLASLAVPIVANGFRAYGIVLLAYVTNNRLAVGVDHIIYGWIFFTAVQLLLFSAGLKWREALPVQAGHSSFEEDQANAHAKALSKSVTLAAACVLFVVASAPLVAKYLWTRVATRAAQTTLVASKPWRPVPAYIGTWAPALSPESQLSDRYVSPDGRAVDAYMARYTGRRGVELVSGYNQFSNPKMWSDVGRGTKKVIINGRSAEVHWNLLQSSFELRVVWTWYFISGNMIAEPARVKLLQIEAPLVAKPSAAAVIALSAPYHVNPSEAESVLQDFLNHASISSAPVSRAQ